MQTRSTGGEPAVVWRDGAQITRAVPIGLIENHDDLLVLPARGSEALEELLACLGVSVRRNEGEAVGFDRREDVGGREAPIAQPWRVLAAPPDVHVLPSRYGRWPQWRCGAITAA